MALLTVRQPGWILLGLAIPVAWAQRGTGELRLTIQDATGAGVAATVELVNQSTHTGESIRLPATDRFAFKNVRRVPAPGIANRLRAPSESSSRSAPRRRRTARSGWASCRSKQPSM